MTTTPNVLTYTERIGGTEVAEDLLAELREDLVNSLDDAMGKCPHEGVSSKWDLCNACAADQAVKVMRHLLDYERSEVTR